MAKLNRELTTVRDVLFEISENYQKNTKLKKAISRKELLSYLVDMENQLIYSYESKNNTLIPSGIYDNLESEVNKLQVDYDITKDQLISLYERRFNRKKFVHHLDSINGCPICDGQLSNTIDHYLPKDKFIHYILAPSNLTPLCAECNKNKSNYFSNNREESPFHPYFEEYDFKEVVEVDIDSTDGIKVSLQIQDGLDSNQNRYKLNYESIFKLEKQYNILARSVYHHFVVSLSDRLDISRKDLEKLINVKHTKITEDERYLFRESFIRYKIFKKLNSIYDENIYESIIKDIFYSINKHQKYNEKN